MRRCAPAARHYQFRNGPPKKSSDIEAIHGLRPQLRIGINSGLAVVGQVERTDDAIMTALGDTLNLASRLQELCQPGCVTMSEATQRLVDGMVESRFDGERQIRGKAYPQRVFRLEFIRHGAGRFEAGSRDVTQLMLHSASLPARKIEEATDLMVRIIRRFGQPHHEPDKAN